jgi:hypothetical protein
MPSYRIKDWNKFQHFKDRKPPWVKLYRDILDDMEWHELDPQAAKALVMFWLIASETDGMLPDIKKLAFRLRTTESKINEVISKLSHWLEQVDIGVISERYQDDPLETERETEEERETEKKTRVPRFDAQAHLESLGVDSQVAKDWITHRRTKKAAPTETAIEGIDKEARKAGISLQAALTVSCQRGWQGFNAEWMKGSQGPPRGPSWSEKNDEVIAQLTGRNRYEPDDRTIDV